MGAGLAETLLVICIEISDHQLEVIVVKTTRKAARGLTQRANLTPYCSLTMGLGVSFTFSNLNVPLILGLSLFL